MSHNSRNAARALGVSLPDSRTRVQRVAAKADGRHSGMLGYGFVASFQVPSGDSLNQPWNSGQPASIARDHPHPHGHTRIRSSPPLRLRDGSTSKTLPPSNPDTSARIPGCQLDQIYFVMRSNSSAATARSTSSEIHAAHRLDIGPRCRSWRGEVRHDRLRFKFA